MALTRFFQRDSRAGREPDAVSEHMEEEFFAWLHSMGVSSWAASVRPGILRRGLRAPPSEGDLPRAPGTAARREVRARRPGTRSSKTRRWALTDACRREARQPGLTGCAEACSAFVQQDPLGHYILWHDLEAERQAIDALFAWTCTDVYGTSRPGRTRSSHDHRHISLTGESSTCSATKPEMSGSGVQLSAPLPQGDLPRHRLPVQRLHPGHPPDLPVPPGAFEVRDPHHLHGSGAASTRHAAARSGREDDELRDSG
jgi:hypothetical protein